MECYPPVAARKPSLQRSRTKINQWGTSPRPDNGYLNSEKIRAALTKLLAQNIGQTVH
jgi:hypothetical protein